jgi:hypothetical protein
MEAWPRSTEPHALQCPYACLTLARSSAERKHTEVLALWGLSVKFSLVPLRQTSCAFGATKEDFFPDGSDMRCKIPS